MPSRVPSGHETKSSILYLHSPTVRSKDIVRLSGDPLIQDSHNAPLDRLWSSADAYMDLAASAADAAKYFQGQTDREVDKLFWSQSNVPERPLSLADQLAEWAELNRLSGLAMRAVVDQLWPEKQQPDSYFSLVQQFLGAVPCINAIKRSACIKGSWMALARVKAYWAEMDASVVAA